MPQPNILAIAEEGTAVLDASEVGVNILP